MPVIFEDGRYRFKIYPRENDFEPPHVHVLIGNEFECRIELNSGVFMDNLPPGHYRNIMELYRKNVALFRSEWDRLHRR